ncbi:hypothetical protein BV22DRAFT_537176 [Leucogyrophana mollusca]|uniref:Uncharacterized protein n=1 Tax=Leucogyrophana mollusca TaxID=85980 RepID=A0ACB8BE20_9AGAM|nr:hypothetical protein BV22DRAFT_537176 [Leucogyrophana mollusca]
MLPRSGSLTLKLVSSLPEDVPQPPPGCHMPSHQVHPTHSTATAADQSVDDARKRLQSRTCGDSDYVTSLRDLGNALMDRFSQTRNPLDVEEAIGHLRLLIDATPIGHQVPFGSLATLGNALMARFRLQGNMVDLNQAIGYQSDALELCAPDGPHYVPLIINHGSLLRDRFARNGDPKDLERALQLYSTALDSCPLHSPHRDSLLNNYANTLVHRFERHADSNDMALAIDHYHESLKLRPPGHPTRYKALSNLGDALHIRFGHKGDPDDLEISAAHYLSALQLCPPGDTVYPVLLTNLGVVWWSAFLYHGDMQKLQGAVQAYATALPLCPREHSHHPKLLANYGSALRTRFKHTGDTDDLDAAIRLYTEALTLQPAGNQDRFSTLLGLGIALWDRFYDRGNYSDLQDALTHFTSSLELCAPDHAEYPTLLASYSAALITRYKEKGDLTDLDLAIDHANQAFVKCPPGHSSRITSITTINSALMARFRQRKDVRDLELILERCNSCLRETPSGNHGRMGLLMDQAEAFLERFLHEGNPGDLSSAIHIYEELVDTAHEGQAAFAVGHIQLGTALQVRFKENGKATDLDRAIDYFRIALKVCQPGHTNHIHSLTNLGNALLTRFSYFHDLDALDLSAEYLTEVLEMHTHSVDHPDYCAWLVNLSHVLIVRFQEKRDQVDLTRAIELLTSALQLPNLSERSIVLMNLGTALSIQFDEDSSPEGLELSIRHITAASELLPATHPLHITALRNLGRALVKLYHLKKQLDQLDRAIEHLEASLKLTAPDHPDLPLTMMTLADALWDRFAGSHPRSLKDLNGCLALLSSVFAALPNDHPYLHHLYISVATVQLSLYGLDKDAERPTAAFEALERATSLGTSGVRSQLDAALRWMGNAERHHHPSALEAYRKSLDLLDRFVLSTPSVALRHRVLHQKSLVQQAPTLASDATACALREDLVELAVELSEQGRGLLWSQMARFRTPLDVLRATDEEGHGLADELERISSALGRRSSESSSNSDSEKKSRMLLEEEARKYRMFSVEWDTLVEKIRGKKGFANFLKPTPYEELKEAAAHGPVIVVNISQHRCDAVIVLKDEKPCLVTLLDATLENVAQMSSDFTDVLNNTSGVGEEKMRERQLVPILRRLWETVVEPVVEELATIVPKGSRIWWCPSSKLTSLPLHAAGAYRRGANNLSNIYVSSYTPTLSALIRSRRDIPTKPRPIATSAFLGVGQAKPNESSQERELKSVGTELELVKSLVPPSMSYHQLAGDEGTSEAAIQGLREHSWVHLACHGKQDVSQPFDSSFALRDKPLRLLDIIQAELEHPQFAFLSACHTAVGDKNTPDEVIHLAAGMQFSGFRSVIGTMWAVDDTTAQRMGFEQSS